MHKIERKPKFQGTINSKHMGGLLPWKMRPLKHTLLISSVTFRLLCAWYSHTKCLGECKTIHKHNEHHCTSVFLEEAETLFSFYRWGQRQTLYCTSISNQLVQIYKWENIWTLPAYSRSVGLGKKGGRENILPESLRTGMCLITRCWHKTFFTSTAHGSILGVEDKKWENRI